jgi:hypothetical protein
MFEGERIAMAAVEELDRPATLQRFYRKRRDSCSPWTATNGERCHDANLPFEPSMRRAFWQNEAKMLNLFKETASNARVD